MRAVHRRTLPLPVFSQGAGNQRRSGHVVRVNGAARTAVVRWGSIDAKGLGPDQEPETDGGKTHQEEEVSCYTLRVRACLRWACVAVCRCMVATELQRELHMHLCMYGSYCFMCSRACCREASQYLTNSTEN